MAISGTLLTENAFNVTPHARLVRETSFNVQVVQIYKLSMVEHAWIRATKENISPNCKDNVYHAKITALNVPPMLVWSVKILFDIFHK